jgi:protein arginine N-methyltransferase 5
VFCVCVFDFRRTCVLLPPDTKQRRIPIMAADLMLLLPPWQPLSGNQTTSEYWEMGLDRQKCTLYRQAISSAICAITQAGTDISVVGVVGAGFGGLVQCVLDVFREAEVQCYVLALDKNPAALAELRRRKRTEKDWISVDIFHMDMRDKQFPKAFIGKVDILVSELLGGFGDNELAPECMIACHRLLTPTGVAIPRSTTSYLAPVNAGSFRRILLNSVDHNDRERWWVHEQNSSKHTDVVLLAEPQPVFSFVYPQKGATLYRSRSISFDTCKPASNLIGKSDSWCHGFMGYFEAELHGQIKVSTLPGRATPYLRE